MEYNFCYIFEDDDHNFPQFDSDELNRASKFREIESISQNQYLRAKFKIEFDRDDLLIPEHVIIWHFHGENSPEKHFLLNRFETYQNGRYPKGGEHDQVLGNGKVLKMVQVKINVRMGTTSWTTTRFCRMRPEIEDRKSMMLPSRKTGHLVRFSLFFRHNTSLLQKFFELTREVFRGEDLPEGTSFLFKFNLKTVTRPNIEIGTACNDPPTIVRECSSDRSSDKLEDNNLYDLREQFKYQVNVIVKHEINPIELYIPKKSNLNGDRSTGFFDPCSPSSVNVCFEPDLFKLGSNPDQFESGLGIATVTLKFDDLCSNPDVDNFRDAYLFQNIGQNLLIESKVVRNQNNEQAATVIPAQENRRFWLDNQVMNELKPLSGTKSIEVKATLLLKFNISPFNEFNNPNCVGQAYWAFIPLKSLKFNWEWLRDSDTVLEEQNENFVYLTRPSENDVWPSSPAKDALLKKTKDVIKNIEYSCRSKLVNAKYNLYHTLNIFTNRDYILPANAHRKLKPGGTIELHFIFQKDESMLTGGQNNYYGRTEDGSERRKKKEKEYNSVEFALLEDVMKEIQFDWDYTYKVSFHANNTMEYDVFDSPPSFDLVWSNESGPAVFTNQPGRFDPESYIRQYSRRALGVNCRREFIIISKPFPQIRSIKIEYENAKTRVQHMFIGLGGDVNGRDFDTAGNSDCSDISYYSTFLRRLKRKVSLALDPMQREYLGIKCIKPLACAGQTTTIKEVNPSTLYWTPDKFRKDEEYGKKLVFKFHFKTEMSSSQIPRDKISIKFNIRMIDQKRSSDKPNPEWYENVIVETELSEIDETNELDDVQFLECLSVVDYDAKRTNRNDRVFLCPGPRTPERLFQRANTRRSVTQPSAGMQQQKNTTISNRERLEEMTRCVKINGEIDMYKIQQSSFYNEYQHVLQSQV